MTQQEEALNRKAAGQAMLNQVRFKQYAANLEYSIKYRMLIKAHQENIQDQNKKMNSTFSQSSQQNNVQQSEYVAPQSEAGNTFYSSRNQEHTRKVSLALSESDQFTSKGAENNRQRRQSMSYLSNALSKIAQEEKKKSLKQRLTQLQKNRIALNYLKFREGTNENDLKGYDQAIQKLDEDVPYTLPTERKNILKLMDSFTDYISNKKLQEPTRGNGFTRNFSTKSEGMYGINPYNSTSSTRQRQRMKSKDDISRMLKVSYQPYKTSAAAFSLSKIVSDEFLAKDEYGEVDLSCIEDRIDPNYTQMLGTKERNRTSCDNSYGNTQRLGHATFANYSGSQYKAYLMGNHQMKTIRENPKDLHPNSRNAQDYLSQKRERARTYSHQDKIEKIKTKCEFALLEPLKIVFKEVQDKMLDDYEDQMEVKSRQLYEPRTLSKQSIQIKRKLRKYKEKQQIQQAEEYTEDYTQKITQSNRSQSSSQYPKSFQIFRDSIANNSSLKFFNKDGHNPILNNEEDRYVSPFTILLKSKDRRIKYKVDDILTENMDRTIEKINEFEKNEGFNKLSLREISNKYKDFNFKRNQRLKNKSKMIL